MADHKGVHVVLGLLCVIFLVKKSGAYEFVVGGQKGWSVPGDASFNPYNTWAEKSRFQIGDSLVFNYKSGQDSVLQVKSEDYAKCNTDSPTAKFSDGHTVFKFNQSGHHFFISGNKDNCLKNEKMVVVVLADRSSKNSNTTQDTTAYSPPSPSPSASLAPSPAAAEQGPPPSPTPSGTVEINPTPAPVSEPPPGSPSHNAASSILFSFAGSLGALIVASTLV